MSGLAETGPPAVDSEIANGAFPFATASLNATGSLKYAATAAFISALSPDIHITRKKAIIAVMKSANATFQAPP